MSQSFSDFADAIVALVLADGTFEEKVGECIEEYIDENVDINSKVDEAVEREIDKQIDKFESRVESQINDKFEELNIDNRLDETSEELIAIKAECVSLTHRLDIAFQDINPIYDKNIFDRVEKLEKLEKQGRRRWTDYVIWTCLVLFTYALVKIQS